MCLPNPGVLAAGVGGRTYDEFVAHITALAMSGTLGWPTESQSAGKWRTTAGPGTGSMAGSSWLAAFRRLTAATARIVQHGLPSQSVFDQVSAAGSAVFLSIENVASQPTTGVNRNGFASSGAPAATANICTELIGWWDGRAWKMNPNAGTGPEPYDW